LPVRFLFLGFVSIVLSTANADVYQTSSLTEDLNRGEAVCFQKIYTKGHLERHPKQTVERIKVRLHRDESAALSRRTYHLDVLVQLSGTGRRYANQMICELSDADHGEERITSSSARPREILECAVECDGGTARVQWRLHRPREVLFINEGITLESSSSIQEDIGCSQQDHIYLRPVTGGDDRFQLRRQSKCGP
jgi:hypothetical protein